MTIHKTYCIKLFILTNYIKIKRLLICSSDITRDLQRLSWSLHQKTSYSWSCRVWGKAHRESGHASSSSWRPEVITNKTRLPIKIYLLKSCWSCQIFLSFQNWWGNLFILFFKSESLCTTQTFYLLPNIWICRKLVFEILCLRFLLRYLVSSRCSAKCLSLKCLNIDTSPRHSTWFKT